ncbi:aspartyl protease family protein [Polaribacter sp. Hel1_85]|uniref:aspartyl protease family protein n=1 Tax=Polaribacter sp. Hel1_85 TaxID=1250005 RepID=UPI00052C941F|nr:aspartyl protease family protein [Polaribacter sp. Hel1_85]KGL63613.1 PDZ/DHR/GLGF domain protein [Polaribacter sp. Hel1_85]
MIPLEINGKRLSFILDTGVNKTILFNLSENDSIGLLNTSKIELRGLGTGEPVSAIISKKNTFKLKYLISRNETIYVILKDYFDLSSKMGTTIHGIIGYNLLKDFIVEVNYKSKKINFYNPKTYKYKKCKKCETTPFMFYRKKPFIKAKVSLDTIGNKFIDALLLVDFGGSDAMWLFENSKEEIKTPKRFFNDILGEGLSGPIYGNRSRVSKFKLGRFEIEKPTVSFLDSASTHNARDLKQRNGSIGGGILKRFKVWIDYPNNKFTFKKNGSFKNDFNYNMSGLDVIYNGKELVKEKNITNISDAYGQRPNEKNSISFVTTYSFNFKHSYKIKHVVENSPAFYAGLLKDDVIIKINGKLAHDITIGDINQMFQEKDKKKIKITVKRNGVLMKFEFRLHKSV